jgi:predicted RNA-binding protein (TIGR00451 family)
MALTEARRAVQFPGEYRRISIMLDYLFGRGVSRALPKEGVRVVYSRRSGRVKLVFHDGKLLATVKPNGAMALSMYGAELLSRCPSFRHNYVVVSDEAAEFVRGGKSVFCKFVESAGRNVMPKGEVVVADRRGKLLGVGTAIMKGEYMREFKSGAAVKVRAGREK